MRGEGREKERRNCWAKIVQQENQRNTKPKKHIRSKNLQFVFIDVTDTSAHLSLLLAFWGAFIRGRLYIYTKLALFLYAVERPLHNHIPLYKRRRRHSLPTDIYRERIYQSSQWVTSSSPSYCLPSFSLFIFFQQ